MHMLSLGAAALLAWTASAPDALSPNSIDLADRLVLPSTRTSAEDSTVAEARAALEARRPWRATQLLDAVLADPERRTADAVLLAAEAAAMWEGWNEVSRLLERAPWLDSLADGRGHHLLARAALSTRPRSRATDSAAAMHAEAAVRRAGGEEQRGVRLAMLAQALDRLDRLDSAGATYLRAGASLPEAGDWLRLRAAAVTRDSAPRATLLAEVHGAVARERVPWTEAAARARAGDTLGAAREYAALGANATALRLRLAVAEPGDRAAIRRELADIVRTRPRTADARDAAALLGDSFSPLAPGEQLAIARSAAVVGPTTRAVAAYRAALAAGLGNGTDRYTYGVLLSRAHRDAEAVTQFARVPAPRELAARAAYQRARSLLRAGRGGEARAARRQVTTRHAATAASAAQALYLLADLATDDGRDGAARDALRTLALRYPGSSLAARARHQAAVIAYVEGDARTAAAEFDALVERYPRSSERLAATYWAGRAWARAGDSARARARWQDVAVRQPSSYYAALANRRLGAPAWSPPGAREEVRPDTLAERALARAALLERVGLDEEAALEYAALRGARESSAPRLLAIAAAYEAQGLASPAITFAQRALARGATPDAAVYRLLNPLPYREVLEAEAAAHDVDPALVAALVRQESYFTPRATSGPGARGLMQIMPATGAKLAKSAGITHWDPVLLWQPDVSLQLGTMHLAELLGDYEHPAYALAAYNAGQSPVGRWTRRAGASDPELFVERIPYVETRDYVRIVLHNRELYRALYGR
jgi:soluble lytic murein transglycosylase